MARIFIISKFPSLIKDVLKHPVQRIGNVLQACKRFKF